jgi:uncharacterized protein YndB with AHSA1/START domain
MNDAATVDVRVVRHFAASAERVFDAWLTPRLLGQWMFGPSVREEKILRLDIDPRVGGMFSMLVDRQGETIDHLGTYLEIDRPHRLVFTWGIRGVSDPDDSRVAIDIMPTENGCELTLIHSLHPDWAYSAQSGCREWIRVSSQPFYVGMM